MKRSSPSNAVATAETATDPVRDRGQLPHASQRARSHRILVVDDNVDVAESLAMLLRLDGHEVTIAHDGVHALAAAQAVQPGVVLLDIGLPDMDGYEVCRRLRAAGHTHTRVIALTGYDQDNDKQLALDAGFDEHAVKPVGFERLLRLLSAAS